MADPEEILARAAREPSVERPDGGGAHGGLGRAARAVGGGPAQAVPSNQLSYLLWDGTDAIDSHRLGAALRARGWANLVDGEPESDVLPRARPGRERVVAVAGVDGRGTLTNAQWANALVNSPVAFLEANTPGGSADFLAYSGHGIPGCMFAENNVLIASSRPIEFVPRATPPWRFVANPHVDNPRTKVLLFSACRQLCGRPQQFRWSQIMRGSNPVHMILSYRETAPSASVSAGIHADFVARALRGVPMIDAWQQAHGTAHASRWAALFYEVCRGDRLDQWTTSGTLSSAPTSTGAIHYIDSSGTHVVSGDTPRHLEVWSSPARGSSAPVNPWFVYQADTAADVNIDFLADSFQPDDEIWLGLLQVRPDYAADGFDINNLVSLDGVTPGPTSSVQNLGRLHDHRRGWNVDTYNDVYAFRYGTRPTAFTANSTNTRITIPVRFRRQVNAHVPVFYFMVRVVGMRNGTRTEWGLPTTTVGAVPAADMAQLENYHQYNVFLLVR